MIRFFRKIRHKLLVEGKLKSYTVYAIGEIFLVVVGILIALQINNWNQGRKDRITEIVLLKELQENLRLEGESLTEILGGVERSLNAVEELVGFGSVDPIPEDLFKLRAGEITVYFVFFPIDSAFETLSASGVSVSDLKLKSRLAKYYGNQQELFLSHLANSERFFKQRMEDFFLHYFESVKPFEEAIPFDLKNEKMRKTLSKLLPFWRQYLQFCKSQTESVLKNNDELLVLIEEELVLLQQ